MKVAHVKTVDGTTIMITLATKEREEGFIKFLQDPSENAVARLSWEDNMYLYLRHIISVRFREVEDK